MRYGLPKEEDLTETYNDAEYKVKYFKPATTISGVTDESYPIWDGTAVDTGDYVIVDSLKKIYRSSTDSNTSYPPANLDTWTDYGVINSYSMFASDESIGNKTTGTDCVFEFDFSRCDTFAMVETDFTSCLVELFDENDDLLYSETIDGSDIGALSFAEYYYTDKILKRRIVVTDLEWLPTSRLKLTFDGAVSIGTFVYCLSVELGATLYGTKLGFESSSKINTNETTGYREVIRYGNYRTLDVSILFDTTDFNTIAQATQEVIDRNTLWIPSDKDKFSEFITIGYIENFDIPIDHPNVIQTNSTIIGVHG